MRMTVITNEAGEVIGTARYRVEDATGSGGAGGPIAGPEHAAHDIEVPEELRKIEDVGELHRKLQGLLKK